MPFPTWRTKRAKGLEQGERREPALIVPLDPRFWPGPDGPAPGPSAA